jgi:predicted transcriptional regulator
MNYPTFTVTVTREDTLWVAVVSDGLERGYVGADDFEHFVDIDPGMREIIADLTGIQPSQFNVSWRYEFGDEDETALVLEYQEAHRIAEDMAEWRDRVRSRLVSDLSKKLSQRAVADLLGLSHQRVNQLSHGPVPEFSLALPAVDELADALRRSLGMDREGFLMAIAQLNSMASSSNRNQEEAEEEAASSACRG